MSARIVTKETIKRLMRDVRNCKKNPLESHGIFYQHDETDMMLGRALIVGPENTPYFGGNFFFRFQFPDDYPFRPPTVVFCSNGDRIRMNPNLYISGKVCVSILNTWSGEQWSSCQTISSVLLALQSLFCADPFLNEPGITRNHFQFDNYNKIIYFKTIEITILKMLLKHEEYFLKEFDCFDEYVLSNFKRNWPKMRIFMEEQAQNPPMWVSHSFYRMHCQIDYSSLLLSFPDSITMEA